MITTGFILGINSTEKLAVAKNMADIRDMAAPEHGKVLAKCSISTIFTPFQSLFVGKQKAIAISTYRHLSNLSYVELERPYLLIHLYDP